MRKIYNAIDRWRYFFACREEWSPPLPLGAPRPMSYWSLGLYYLYSLVLLIGLPLWVKVWCIGYARRLFQFVSSSFSILGNKVCLERFGVLYSNRLLLFQGTFVERRSSLGRFLNAPLHYTKNTLLSQGVTPL